MYCWIINLFDLHRLSLITATPKCVKVGLLSRITSLQQETQTDAPAFALTMTKSYVILYLTHITTRDNEMKNCNIECV